MIWRLLREERGMALGLAIIVVVIVGVMGAGLLTFVATDLERVMNLACYELGRKSHRNADFTVSLVPSRSLFSAFLSRF